MCHHGGATGRPLTGPSVTHTAMTTRPSLTSPSAAGWPDADAPRPRLKKHLGQHFLTNRGILQHITNAAELTADDVAVEVGPGAGVLTEQLVAQAGRVIAVEVDSDLLPQLQTRFAAAPHFHLVHGDILDLPPGELLAGAGLPAEQPYKLVANLPYYITAPVLRHFLTAANRPTRLVVLVQLEVASRLVAAPGDFSLLAIAVQFYGRPSLITKVSPGSFNPPPKVSSAVVRIDTYERPPVQVPGEAAFFATVRAGFRAPRKQLRNSLSQGWGVPGAEAAALVEAAGIDPQRRPETLTLDEWARLTWAWERRQ